MEIASAHRLVAYERVSTARQGASGLGLEAQRKVIEDFAVARGADVLARFSEVASGRKADRPELAKALHLAKVTGATLVIAKLDRLSRNAAFLLAFRDSGVRFVAVDMPGANDLTVGNMALVAQAEREAISRRTKEALAVAKARGVKLGNPNGAESLRRAGKGRSCVASGGVGECGCLRAGLAASAGGHSDGRTHVAAVDRDRADRARDPDAAWRALECWECRATLAAKWAPKLSAHMYVSAAVRN